MPRTQQSNDSAQAKPDLSIDADAISNLRDLLVQRKKLDEAVDAAPADIHLAEAELIILRQQMASLEADIVLIDEAKLPAKQKEINSLAESISERDFTVRRTKARLAALEAKAPELDEKIDIAIGFVRVEADIAAQSVRSALATEIHSKIRDLQLIYAKVRALSSLVPDIKSRDFLQSAVIPDLDSCMRITAASGTYEASTNLLSLKDEGTDKVEASICEAMRPITEVLALARKHRPYVPLAKRPAPYVRKGTWDGPGGRVERPEEPEEQPARMKTLEEALAEPYEVKGDSSGLRTWKQAQEMNMAKAMTEAQSSVSQTEATGE